MSCPLRGTADDSQEHLLDCNAIRTYHKTQIKYRDIFCNDTNKLFEVVQEMKKIIKIREELLDEED